MIFLYPIVFVSGILTVLSPCVLPILPIILGSGLEGKKSRINGTILGLIVSFTFFALLLSTIVSSLGISADSLRIAAAVILGFFGVSLVIPKIWEGIQVRMERIFQPPQQTNTQEQGFWGGFLTGAVLGLVWTPCVGPIIATVTTLAALQSFSLTLVLLILTYAVGLGVPLFAIARGGALISQRLGWYRQNQGSVRRWFGVIIIITALLIGTGGERAFQAWVLDNLPESVSNPVEQFEERFEVMDILDESMNEQSLPAQTTGEVVNNVRLRLEKEGAKVPLNELLNGCPIKDCIPAIDDPVFESVTAADTWLEDQDRIFVLNYQGVRKAYPQRIMNWHEIVNDWYPNEAAADKTPIAITFCPLCGTATAFERRVNGVITEFGVSGKLYNSDLVMYDRFEGNLWQQVTAEAITGPAARRDEVLEPLFLVTLEWSQVKDRYPEVEVLSRKTGHNRNYDAYPYGSYESDAGIYFPVGNEDERLHPKAWVYGIEVNGEAKAYPEDKIIQQLSFTDTVGGQQIRMINDEGEILFENLATKEQIVPLRSFWFAWVAFHPSTLLY